MSAKAPLELVRSTQGANGATTPWIRCPLTSKPQDTKSAELGQFSGCAVVRKLEKRQDIASVPCNIAAQEEVWR